MHVTCSTHCGLLTLFMERVEAERRLVVLLPERMPRSCKTSMAMSSMTISDHFMSEEQGLAREDGPCPRPVWDKVVESQIETGTPYMLYKDAANIQVQSEELGDHPLLQPVH